MRNLGLRHLLEEGTNEVPGSCAEINIDGTDPVTVIAEPVKAATAIDIIIAAAPDEGFIIVGTNDCPGPLKLSHCLFSFGVFGYGKEALFGRGCSASFA